LGHQTTIPQNRKGEGRNARWFQSLDDLNENFSYGTFDHMIVFRHCGGELPFGRFLKEIVLDNPSMKSSRGGNLFSAAYGALRLAMTDSGLDVPIRKRVCPSGCQCKRKTIREPPAPREGLSRADSSNEIKVCFPRGNVLAKASKPVVSIWDRVSETVLRDHSSRS
jgi:hypothetical protein